MTCLVCGYLDCEDPPLVDDYNDIHGTRCERCETWFDAADLVFFTTRLLPIQREVLTRALSAGRVDPAWRPFASTDRALDENELRDRRVAYTYAIDEDGCDLLPGIDCRYWADTYWLLDVHATRDRRTVVTDLDADDLHEELETRGQGLRTRPQHEIAVRERIPAARHVPPSQKVATLSAPPRAIAPDEPRLIELYDAILANPELIEARRVYADALLERNDPRGELIAVQCDLHELVDAEHRSELLRREYALLANHADFAHARYHRGLVEIVKIDRFLDRAWRREPILDAFVSGYPTGDALRGVHTLRGVDGTTDAWIESMAAQGCRPRTITLESPYRMGESLGAIEKHWIAPHLERLLVRSNTLPFSYARLAELAPQLRDFALVGYWGDAPEASALGGLATPMLEGLTMGSQRYRNESLPVLVQQPCTRGLVRLGLPGNWIPGYALGELAKLPRLRELDVSQNRINGGSVVSLLALALTSLDLSGNTVGDDGLLELARGLSSLRDLRIAKNGITDAGLSLLSESTWQLEYLDLSNNPISDVGIHALAAAPWARTLRTLVLSSCNLTDAGIGALSSYAWQRLERIVLDGNPITESSVVSLATAEAMPELVDVACSVKSVSRRARQRWGILPTNAMYANDRSPFADPLARLGPHAYAMRVDLDQEG